MSSIFEFFAGLWHFAAEFVESLGNQAEGYGVNPAIFVSLYLVTWPMWYYTMWYLVSGWHRKDPRRMRIGVWSNRVVTVTPYVYVLLAGGTGLPISWFLFFIILPLVTTSWFLWRIKDDEWLEKWWEAYQKALSRLKFNKKSTTTKEV